jgi:hypothetical protein
LPVLLVLFDQSVTLQESSQWFPISEAGSRIWRIEDHGAANIYLVEGDEQAPIIDTDMGLADLPVMRL